jgi:hypothetical protein
MRTILPMLLAGFLSGALGASAQTNRAALPEECQGKYFAHARYVPHPLPQFAELRSRLPASIYDELPEWVNMYWKAWELAFQNFHEPAAGSGYVSQFIDAALNQNIFLLDTCFMTMFCNYA